MLVLRISRTISSADFSRAPGMSRPPAGIAVTPSACAQHVIDDVVVRVIEFQPAAASGSVVGSQGQMQQLVREHEHEIVIGEPGRKGRICNQAAGGENAHCRHAIVEIDTHRCGKAGKVRQWHRDHPQRPHDAGERLRDQTASLSKRRSCRGDLAQKVEHRAISAKRPPFLDHIGQQRQLMLGRQAAQEAIDDPRLEGVGLAVAHELPDAVEDEPARGIALR